MLEKLKHTIKQTAIYGLGGVMTKVVGLVLLPLYTSYLTVEDYGILGILESTAMFLTVVLSFNIGTATMRWCTAIEDHEKQKPVIGMSLLFLLIILIFFNLVALPFSQELSELFFGTPDLTRYFIILFGSVSLEVLTQLPLELLRFRESAKLYVLASTSKLVIILIANIYFVTVVKLGVEGILLSQLFGNVLIFIFTFPMILKNSSFQINWSLGKDLIMFGYPLMLSSVSSILLTLSDRYIIAYFLDYSSVGLYILGHKFASLINIFLIQSFSLGFVPLAYKKYNEPDFKRFFSKSFTYFTLVIIFSILALSAFSLETIKVFALNADFWSAHALVPLLACAFLFKGTRYMFTLSFQFARKTKPHFFIMSTGLVVNIIANFSLIPKYGLYGAAFGTILAGIYMTIASNIIGQKVFPVNYELTKFYKLLVLLTVLLSINHWINDMDVDMNIVARLILKSILLITFPLILYLWNFLDPIEITRLKGFINKLIKLNFYTKKR